MTTFTKQDIENAKVIETTVDRVRSYLEGEEIQFPWSIGIAINNFDDALDECQGDVKISGEPRLLIIQVKP